MNNKIGLITFHSAYNYGSVLQAFSTQAALRKLGFDAEIINYRMDSQKDIYSLYPKTMGYRVYIRSILQIPIQNKRKIRIRKFENFINNKMKLTDVFNQFGDINKLYENYGTIISGSDQIWNKHSLELEKCSWKYMIPYLLGGFNGRKISYASSLTDMSKEEINKIVPYIKSFDYISCRENSTCQILSSILDRNIYNVLDPTLLLNKKEWISLLGLREETRVPKTKYILYYSLSGIRGMREKIQFVNQYAMKQNCILKVLTPNAYIADIRHRVDFVADLGPVDFLNCILNAETVVTDSYHGTVFALNFNKLFFSVSNSGSSDRRKNEILSLLGLEARIISSYETLLSNSETGIDYVSVNSKLENLRIKSYKYLQEALTKA